MIADVSADGNQHPQPTWLAAHRLAERCACYLTDDPCAIHGKFRTPSCAQPCAATIVRELAGQGVEVDAQPEPPKTLDVWTETRLCPHGRRFWMQPSAEQLRIWRINEGGWTSDGITTSRVHGAG